MSNLFDTHKFDAIDLNEVNSEAEAYREAKAELRKEIEIDVAIPEEIRTEFKQNGRLSAETWFRLVYGISLKRCAQITAYMLVVGAVLFGGIFVLNRWYNASHPLEVTAQKVSEDGTVYYEHTAGENTWITTEPDDDGPFWEAVNRAYSFFAKDGKYSK